MALSVVTFLSLLLSASSSCFLFSSLFFSSFFSALDDNLHRVPHAKRLSLAAMPTKNCCPAAVPLIWTIPVFRMHGWRGHLCRHKGGGGPFLVRAGNKSIQRFVPNVGCWLLSFVCAQWPAKMADAHCVSRFPRCFCSPPFPPNFPFLHLQLGWINGQNKKYRKGPTYRAVR